jgi:sporulation protein YlmC with PRC-barrel domain
MDDEPLDLIRDVLDNQLVDNRNRRMGKADGIIMVLRKGKPPRVAYIEVGGPTLAARLHPKLGEWATKLAKRFGRGGEIYRIPWSKVKSVGIDIKVLVDAEETSALALEQWLREHVVNRIPGGKS